MHEEEIFHEALARSCPGERAAYLEQACAGDPAQRAAIEVLLRANVGASGFLAEPLPALVATMNAPLTERPGTIIGPYKLLEQIGEGGFGVVFMAEQTQPVRRKVALKVLKPGMDTRQVVARFEAERQALAIMDHPNIAKVFDGGSTEPIADSRLQIADCQSEISNLKSAISGGRPYFVMELVKGLPITAFCDQDHLPVRGRLNLFATVCHAVQHAHQKGIIHRDLKPSNILVTLHDGKPVVKVIDFGIAKATGQHLTDKTLFTNFAQMLGTPLYMSPEQMAMSGLDVDTRSDVYSLGVLLYELLTGTTPFTQERLQGVNYDELRRIISEEEPVRPSTRVGTLGPDATTMSANRRSDPRRLSQLFRGELDWVVMKCLEKDRTRRYESASALAADIERYLHDEPVQACPPSAWYRVRKFARRNKPAMAIATVVAVALLVVVGAVAGSVGWRARDRAMLRATTARQVEQALLDTQELYQRDLVPEALVKAQKAQELLESGWGSEELEQRVRDWLAGLNLVQELEEIRHQWLDEPNVASMHADYAAAFRRRGIDIEALEPAEAAVRVAASPVKEDLAVALERWARTLRNQLKPPDPARWKRLVEIARIADPDPWRDSLRKAVDKHDVETLSNMARAADTVRLPVASQFALAVGLEDAGDRGSAIAFLKQVQRRHPGDFRVNLTLAGMLIRMDPPPIDEVTRFSTAALAIRPRSPLARSSLGLALSQKGDRDEAITECREAVRLKPDLPLLHFNLGVALSERRLWDEAIVAYREALRLQPDYLQANHNLGFVLSEVKQFPEAVDYLKKAIELAPDYVRAHFNLGNVRYRQGNLAEAVACYKQAIELAPQDALAHDNLGAALYAQEKLDEAVPCHRKAIELDPKRPGPHHRLGNVLKDLGRLDEAVIHYQKAIALDPKHERTHFCLGNVFYDQKKLDEAIVCYKKAVELDPKQAVAHFNLGVALSDRKKPDEAIASYRKAIELKPDDERAYINLGNAHRVKGRLDETVAAYRAAIRLRPDYALAHENLGSVLHQKKLLKEAEAAHREAIRLKPDFFRAHHNLGSVLSDQGRHIEAVAAYRAAIKLKPDYAQAYHNLARRLAEMGEVTEAIASFREAIRLRPDYANAYGDLAWLLATGPDPKYWDGPGAVELAMRYGDLAAKDARYWSLLGTAHYRAGNWSQARVAFEKAEELRQGDPGTAWFFLAMTHMQLGNENDARKWYDRAAEWMEKNHPENKQLRRWQAAADELMNRRRSPVDKPPA